MSRIIIPEWCCLWRTYIDTNINHSLFYSCSTPETKVFLDQLSVLGCRLVDAAASGRNKKLLHDVSDAVWAGLELISDPSSTLAFAEVTAYLCFALEMEDALYREQPISRQRAARRRYQRNAYQRSTYTDVNMMQDADTTVEQVMLSSLGEKMDEQGSLPSNVMMPSASEWLQSETEGTEDGLNWRERAADDIDLHLLQEKITKRAAELEEQRERRRRQPDVVDILLRAQEEQKHQTPRASRGTEQSDQQSVSRGSDIEEIIVTTVDENDNDMEFVEETRVTEKTQSATASVKSKTTTDDGLQYQMDKEALAASLENKDGDEIHKYLSETFTTNQPPVSVVDGESASTRFYRRLDEIMDKKRTEAVVNVLNRQRDGQQNSAGLSWFPKAAAAAGAGNERGQDTIKNRVAAIRNAARSQIGVSQQRVEMALDKDTRRTFSYFSIVIGLVGLFWFVMGFYGCYAIVFGPIGWTFFPIAKPITTSDSGVRQEFVVRIVREVVHVNAKGETMEAEYYPPVVPVADENVDQVAACLAKALR